MTFHLLHTGDVALLATERAVIKREERQSFTDAVALLAAVRALHDDVAAAVDRERAAARAEALAETDTAVRALVTDAVAELAQGIDAHETARRGEIADAAFAALRAVIGEIDDATLVARMVDRTLSHLPDAGAVTLSLSPDMAASVGERLDGRLGERAHVRIVADPALRPTDCVARTAQGQVVASLSVQLAAIAQRWGIATGAAA